MIEKSEQLQNQIKKNKTLLQSNFRLMEENQTYLSAFTKLKKHFMPSEQQDVSNIEDVEELISHILSKQFSESINGNEKGKKQGKCECQKWKQLYIRESQEALRLTTQNSKNQQKIASLEKQMGEDREEMQKLLKDYLVLFRRVNEPTYLLEMNERIKQKLKDKSERKEKRSTSRGKGKVHKKNTQSKENAKQTNEDQWKEVDLIFKIIEDLRAQVEKERISNHQLREENSDKEILISVYRAKEREKLIYGQFM